MNEETKEEIKTPLSEKYPHDINWFIEKGLPPSSIMPKEYYDEMEAKGEPEEKPEGETPEGEEPEEPEEIDELLKKTRDELNMMAGEKGLNPDNYANKEEIAKVILEAKE